MLLLCCTAGTILTRFAVSEVSIKLILKFMNARRMFIQVNKKPRLENTKHFLFRKSNSNFTEVQQEVSKLKNEDGQQWRQCHELRVSILCEKVFMCRSSSKLSLRLRILTQSPRWKKLKGKHNLVMVPVNTRYMFFF
jgi:hypothetical protein